ncbi:MAG: mechanosensitive ion channel family protein [Acidobacteriaceae bacterium]|nr:mechanosensitive ion channel family protein [Acidobacteriaceae bacterium]
MNFDLQATTATAIAVLTQLGLKVLGAIVIWFVGRKLIRLAQTLVARGLQQQRLDATIVNYIRTSVGVALNVILVVALLGFFGVETTSFAALLAAMGIAIGAAWSGLMSNFAAGMFLIILRPFKVGDFVTAGGITGTVEAIGLFGTMLNTPDNVATIIGNAKVLGDTIFNFTTNAYRRVELTAQLNSSVNPMEAMQLMKSRLKTIPNVLQNPAPDVEILSFTDAGAQLAVRPYCSNANYWQVYFDTNKAIFEAFSGAGYPAPEHHYAVRTMAAAASAGGAK